MTSKTTKKTPAKTPAKTTTKQAKKTPAKTTTKKLTQKEAKRILVDEYKKNLYEKETLEAKLCEMEKDISFVYQGIRNLEKRGITKKFYSADKVDNIVSRISNHIIIR